AECSVEVARSLKQHPHLKLRMGLHTGPIYRVGDINKNLNVSGSGINIAQRVMDAGDSGHILLSDAAADSLRQLSRWRGSVREAGICKTKDRTLRVWNLYGEDFGNPAPPSKLIPNTIRRNFVLAAA